MTTEAEIDALKRGYEAALAAAQSERDLARAEVAALRRELSGLADIRDTLREVIAERDSAEASRSDFVAVLKWANLKGGLGLDVHGRFHAVLEKWGAK